MPKSCPLLIYPIRTKADVPFYFHGKQSISQMWAMRIMTKSVILTRKWWGKSFDKPQLISFGGVSCSVCSPQCRSELHPHPNPYTQIDLNQIQPYGECGMQQRNLPQHRQSSIVGSMMMTCQGERGLCQGGLCLKLKSNPDQSARLPSCIL